MKITFQQTQTSKMQHLDSSEQMGNTKALRVERQAAQKAMSQTFGADRWFGESKNGKDKKNLEDIRQNAENIDVAVLQDYRTVMSNTLSAEDYAKLDEDGYDFGRLEPGTAVTIVDKIKAELLKAGKEIVGYTDDVDVDTLSEALGSKSLALFVTEKFAESDLPLTEENAAGVKAAWEMTRELKTPTEDGYRYLVNNELDPEIWNYYLAQNSGNSGNSQPKFYREEVGGYLVENAAWDVEKVPETEVEKVLVREGLQPTEENLETAGELLRQNLPLTKENVERYQALKAVTFPISEETFAGAVADAILQGKESIYANLEGGQNKYELAGEWENLLPEAISSRRFLEEVRLRMTAEVNLKLIESGFSIETASMEELVDALKEVEESLARRYFPAEENSLPKYETYRDASRILEEMPAMPISTLGYALRENPESFETLPAIHKLGTELRDIYVKANESYETMMTQPRRDLGDSIRQAFRNVDDILKDLKMEVTEETRRAVRILGYNRMEITPANLEKVATADARVKSIIDRMTPGVTLKMIRDGINPLERTFSELEAYLDERHSSYEEESKNYSRFLYGLEQNKEITEAERESYIGIYRMIRQIEKSDGAVIGTLVGEQANLHFANLLSALRSEKAKNIDIVLDKDFGSLVERVQNGERISDQITKAFAEVPVKEEMKFLRQSVQTNEDIASLLEGAKLPVCAENLAAAGELMDPDGNLFERLKSKYAKELTVPSQKILSSMTDRDTFLETYEEEISSMEEEVKEATVTEVERSIDVRELRLIHTQLSVATALSRNEEYVFPMVLGETVAKIHLTFNRSEEKKGAVDIALDTAYGRMEGHFGLQGNSFTGFLAGNSEEALTKLEEATDNIYESIKEVLDETIEISTLPVIRRSESAIHSNLSPIADREVPGGEGATETQNAELYRVARAFLLAMEK